MSLFTDVSTEQVGVTELFGEGVRDRQRVEQVLVSDSTRIKVLDYSIRFSECHIAHMEGTGRFNNNLL